MSVVCMGELLIDFVALESGVTVGEASGFEKAPGGAPANVAAAVAHLGTEAAFLGQVGDDPFGHYLADVLRDEGVNVDGLRYSDEARTMLAFVSLRDDGERSFMFYRHPSADMLMTPADVATDIIDTARIFHFGSISMINSPAREATLAAADHARTHDTFISYDPNLRMALWPDAESARIGMRRGLDYAHILKVSDDELEFVLHDDETLSDLWQQYEQMQLIILTRGKHGAVLYSRNGAEVSHDGYAVDAVDTTGAGDAFVAGMLVNILEQLSADETLQTLDYSALLNFACATGALTTTGRGAIPSLPTQEAAQDFIARQTS